MDRKFTYTASEVGEARLRACEGYHAVVAEIAKRDADKRGWSEEMERDPQLVQHFANTAICINGSVFTQLEGREGYRSLPAILPTDDVVGVLSAKRLEFSRREINLAGHDYLITYLARLFLDKFINELGGDELMQAVLAKCAEKGNFAARIKSGEFDCQRRA